MLKAAIEPATPLTRRYASVRALTLALAAPPVGCGCDGPVYARRIAGEMASGAYDVVFRNLRPAGSRGGLPAA